jgi:hypothetical protein
MTIIAIITRPTMLLFLRRSLSLGDKLIIGRIKSAQLNAVDWFLA